MVTTVAALRSVLPLFAAQQMQDPEQAQMQIQTPMGMAMTRTKPITMKAMASLMAVVSPLDSEHE